MGYYDPNLQRMQMQGIGMVPQGMGYSMPVLQQPVLQQPVLQQPVGYPAYGYGSALQNLGYNYQLPSLGYSMQSSWSPWDIAQNHSRGIERSAFDTVIGALDNFFSERHLSEEAAKDAHKRVYYEQDGHNSGNRTLGGAAAYQAFLWWDHEHSQLYHQSPTAENRDRLVALAIAELHKLWAEVNPRSSRARFESAVEYCAATGRYLFERHYNIHGHHSSTREHSSIHHRAHSSSGSDAGHSHRRRRSGSIHGREWAAQQLGVGMGVPMGQQMMGQMGYGAYGQQYGMGVMGPGMQQGMMQPGMMQQGMMQQGMLPGMLPGMLQPNMLLPMVDPLQAQVSTVSQDTLVPSHVPSHVPEAKQEEQTILRRSSAVLPLLSAFGHALISLGTLPVYLVACLSEKVRAFDMSAVTFAQLAESIQKIGKKSPSHAHRANRDARDAMRILSLFAPTTVIEQMAYDPRFAQQYGQYGYQQPYGYRY